MAGRTAICPATLGNVICLGRLSPPGEAVIPPLFYRFRNSNKPTRWTSMRASVSPALSVCGLHSLSVVRSRLASGRGRIHSFTTVHRALSPASEDDVPYWERVQRRSMRSW